MKHFFALGLAFSLRTMASGIVALPGRATRC